MKEPLITSQTTELAKEKGCYLESCHCGGYPECICSDKRISQSLLQKWLRDVHKIIVLIEYLDLDEYCYFYSIMEHPRELNMDEYYKEYEEALEIGLIEGLKMIIK